MIEKTYFDTKEVLNYISGYSSFLQQRLEACVEAAYDGYHFLSVLTLLNMLEDTLKSALDDYDDNLNVIAKNAFEQDLLTAIEYSFISFDSNSLRKFRNCIAHKNLSTMYLQFSMEEVLYPLSEEETYKHFYDKYSEIIINLILKIATKNEQYNICVDSLLKNNAYRIHQFSIPDLLELKGYPRDYADNVNLSESDIIRLIDNSSGAFMINAILKCNLTVEEVDKNN